MSTVRQPTAALIADKTVFDEHEVMAWKPSTLKFVLSKLGLPQGTDDPTLLYEAVLKGLSARKMITLAQPVQSEAVTVASVQLMLDNVVDTLNTSFLATTQSVVDGLKLELLTKITALEQTLKLKDSQIARLEAGLESVKLEMQTVKDNCAALQVECTELRTGVKASEAEIKVVQSSVTTLVDSSESAERARRSLNVVLTGLPEEDGETQASLDLAVQDLLTALNAQQAKVVQVTRLGSKKKTFAEAVAGTSDERPKVRPVVVRVTTIGEKIAILKGRINLRNNERFRRLGVNPDLTRQQQAKKAATWPAFVAARKDNKKSWWVDDTLFIEGKPYKAPA